MDDGVCAHVDDAEWYLSTTSSGASGVEQWLQWWIQSGWGDGVHLVDLTEQYSAFNLAGPLSRQVLQQLTAADLSNESLPYMSTRQIAIDGVSCRLLRIGFTGELSYEVHCPSGLPSIFGMPSWKQGPIARSSPLGLKHSGSCDWRKATSSSARTPTLSQILFPPTWPGRKNSRSGISWGSRSLRASLPRAPSSSWSDSRWIAVVRHPTKACRLSSRPAREIWRSWDG